MERYFKRKASCAAEDEINWDEEIQYDPGLRKEIDSYHPNLREKVRRKYLENGPCQPRGINFPLLNIGEKDKQRRFMREWFDEFGPWLEYSEKTQRAYCFYCFLFREKKDAGYDAFVVNGWDGFHRKERLRSHIGEVGGLHYNAMKKCDEQVSATTTVERCFSAMKIVKTSLSNRMGDEHISHRLICYIEKEEMKKVSNEAVVHRFMTMEEKGRKYDL